MSLPNHQTRQYEGIVLERIRHLPPGGKMGDLPEHLQHESFVRKGNKKTGGPNLRIIRLEDDQPSLTVTAYIFNKFVHPTEDRYITPREAALLQDFPEDYEFMGTLGQVQKQIGNAVPVKLAEAIAREVAEYLRNIGQRGCQKIASYFTGAGGLDLGFENVRSEDIFFDTVFATDIEEFSELTISRNRPKWNFVREDIRSLSPDRVRQAIGESPSVVIGGPPCQPFSVAGKQRATEDPLGVLYRDYIHHVEILRPKIVVMENVYGMAQVKSANMIEEIYKSFDEIGYGVKHAELMSADYGTPQKRRRLFFVAAQEVEKFKFPVPSHSPTPNLLGLPLYNGAGAAIKKLPEATLR